MEDVTDRKTLDSISTGSSIETRSVHVKTLDGLLKNEIPSIMKINAMAADLDIIQGARDTIGRCKPTLILEYGVKKEDVFLMIKTIKEIDNSYNFYMRRKRVFDDIKTVLYCV